MQILSQAASEMEAIAVEKKQLIQLWKNSLVAMEKKDEALRLKEEATTKVRESLMVMDAEANGYKLATKIEQDKNEQLTQILNKVLTKYLKLISGDLSPFFFLLKFLRWILLTLL
jgi:hypothetical protein